MDPFDYSSVLSIPFKILQILGFWQVKNASKAYKVYGIIMHFTQVELFLFCQLMYAISASNLFELTDLLSIMFNYIGFCIKSYSFMFQLENIIALTQDFKELVVLSGIVKGEPLTLIKPRVLHVQKIFRVFWYFCLLTTSLGGLSLVIQFAANPNPPYHIPYKFWTPFDYHYNIYGFIFMGILQTLNPIVFCGAIAAIEFLPIFFLNGAAGLLDELAIVFGKIGAKKNGMELKNEKAIEQLKQCIELHLRLKTFISKIEMIFSTTIFVQGAISLIIICTTAFNLSKVHFYQYKYSEFYKSSTYSFHFRTSLRLSW